MVTKNNDNDLERKQEKVVPVKPDGEVRLVNQRGILGRALAEVRKSGTTNRGYPHGVLCEDAHA